MARKSKNIGAVTYIDDVLTELTQQAGKAIINGEVSAVHRARVATRRLAAALDVLSSLIDQYQLDPMRKALKRIRRSVQVMRDLDVMQEHLEDWEKRHSHAAAAVRVRTILHQQRDDTQASVAEHAKVGKWLARVGSWMAVRGQLVAHAGKMDNLVIQSLQEQYAVFAAQADRLSIGLLDQSTQDKPRDIEPHALRIAGKALRYTFEIAQRQKLGVTAGTLRRFKQLQDALGLWHDYHVLTQQVLQTTQAEMAGAAYRGDEDELVLLAGDILKASHRELSTFAKLWRRHRDQLAAELSQIVTRGKDNAPPNVEPQPVQTMSDEVAVSTADATTQTSEVGEV